MSSGVGTRPDVSAPRARVMRVVLELARAYASLPVGTPQLVLDDFTPLSQCSTCAPRTTRRVWFHDPIGLVASRRIQIVVRARELHCLNGSLLYALSMI